MRQLKAFQILSTLNKNEFNKFGKFIISPFFNRSNDLIKLYKSLKNFYPEFDESKISFEKIYAKVYPGKKYNSGTMRNLLSDFGMMAEEFLSFSVYKDSFWFKYNLVTEMVDRRLTGLFAKTSEKIHKEISSKIDTVGQKDLHLALLEMEMNIFILRSNLKPKYDFFSSSYEYLVIYMLKIFFNDFQSLKSSQDNFGRNLGNSIVTSFLENVNIDAIYNSIKNGSIKNIKSFELDYYLFKAYRNEDENFLDELKKAKEILSEINDEISLGEKYSFYIKITNIANCFMKPANIELKRFLFELTKERVEKNITSEQIGGKMIEVEFTIIIEGALIVNETSWAENFLENKINAVDVKHSSDLYNFYKARILFEKGLYDKSNEVLSKVNAESIFFALDLRVQKMKNFYELNYIESAVSQADALTQFLKRNEFVSDKRRKSYANFLKYYRILLNKKSGKKIDLFLSKKEIEESNALRNRTWLLKKIEEFQKT